MKKIKPKSYTKAKNFLCDWTDKKMYLVYYRILKFYVKHGMIVDKIQKKISYKRSRWLERFISFNTQKNKKAKNDSEKGFYKIWNNAFYGKTTENVRNCLRLKFIEKYENKKNTTI